MKITIITLFPEIFPEILNHSILKNAQKQKLVEFQVVNHRDFGIGRHKIVDDKPYGGGIGMVLRVDVLHKAIESVRLNIKDEKVILLDPKGETYTQIMAERFSKLSHLILVCGHYEGFDERIREFVDEEISIGDYVLTGGEIPAMAIADSVTRLVAGVLNPSATQNESHSEVEGKRILEAPHYTRPHEYSGRQVPEILLSGDTKKIESFKKNQPEVITTKKRPDLIS